jgi:hypothetical protein
MMYTEEESESRGIVRILLVAGGLGFLLCVMIGIGATFFYILPQQQSASATKSAEAVAGANTEATRAAQPTPTFRPTRTPAPTQTPRPTRTPAPTEAPTPTIDPAIVEYGTFFFSAVFNLEDAFYDLAILNEQARQNPAMLSNTQWLTDLTRTTAGIEGEAQRVLDYPFATVPTLFVGSHTKLTEAMVLYRDSMVLYRQGINTQDAALIEDAFTNFERANTLIAESGELLPTFE